jgi:hypothetical protein
MVAGSGFVMRFDIDNSTVRHTTKCSENFSCLDGRRECLCSVDDCSEGKIHFIVPERDNLHCDYQIPFGYSFTCNCPVRKEIYNVYRV